MNELDTQARSAHKHTTLKRSVLLVLIIGAMSVTYADQPAADGLDLSRSTIFDSSSIIMLLRCA